MDPQHAQLVQKRALFRRRSAACKFSPSPYQVLDGPMGSAAERSAERVVLVVEDEPTVRRYIARVLGEAGVRVLEAADGQEAVALLATVGATVIWLVVSDIIMPGLTGVKLAATVAARWPAIPVLLVSASFPDHWHGPLLSKPFTPEALVAAVESLLPPPAERSVEIRQARQRCSLGPP